MRRFQSPHPGRPFAASWRKGTVVSLLVFSGLWQGVTLHSAAAQGPTEPRELSISGAHRAAIVDSLTRALDTYYVFPSVARDIGKLVRKKLRQGQYDTLATLGAFTATLMDDFLSVSHDLHMGVRPASPRRPDAEDSLGAARRQEAWRTQMRRNNYGFRKLEILPGNIGYLDLRGFNPAEYGGATAVAAMNFLASADAVIFDLRANGGGSPSMIQLISSYLFQEPTHLNSFYIRRTDSVQQFWTAAHVEGPRMTEVPVYVLTSDRTFSAAEEFTYNLKNLKRATIVGDTTGGGAHPVDDHWFKIDDSIYVETRIPFGRAINPVTGTNWEGTGVVPDVAVPAEQALDAAMLDYCGRRLETEDDEDARYSLLWMQRDLEAKMNPVALDLAAAPALIGVYGPRTITLEDGALYYQREDRPKYKLIPMGDDLFALEGLDYFRLQFVRDPSGAVTEAVGLYNDGHRDASPRTAGP